MFRSFALSPYVVKNESSLERIKALQPIWNKLFNLVARDKDFVTDAFSPISAQCAWTQKELAVYRRCHEYALRKPSLLLSNSIHLSPEGVDEKFVLSVTNVQAGEPFQVQLARDFQEQSHGRGLQNGPLQIHTATIARALKLLNSSSPCVAILTKPAKGLALRTTADAMGIASNLRNVHGVPCVLHVSMQDLARSRIDDCGDLNLDGQKISVIYSRYDFSHPTGQFKTNPADDDRESPIAWKDEWDTIEKIEKSNAVKSLAFSIFIMSSSIGCRLAVRRWMQYVLNQPGNIERFLHNRLEVAMIREVLPEQWSLHCIGEAGRYSLQEARELFEKNPEGFVAKNVLRPRTGSNKTQDRLASGGMILSNANDLRSLFELEADGRPRGRNYIIYRKISPRKHSAVLAHENEVHELDCNAVSEVATYGSYLSDSSSKVLLNELAGVGARTRAASYAHPISKDLGYGAVSGVRAEVNI